MLEHLENRSASPLIGEEYSRLLVHPQHHLLCTSLAGRELSNSWRERQGNSQGATIMKAIFTARPLDHKQKMASGPEETIENKLIDMLKDGRCDLYTAVAVLRSTGRIRVDAQEKNGTQMHVVV